MRPGRNEPFYCMLCIIMALPMNITNWDPPAIPILKNMTDSTTNILCPTGCWILPQTWLSRPNHPPLLSTLSAHCPSSWIWLTLGSPPTFSHNTTVGCPLNLLFKHHSSGPSNLPTPWVVVFVSRMSIQPFNSHSWGWAREPLRASCERVAERAIKRIVCEGEWEGH